MKNEYAPYKWIINDIVKVTLTFIYWIIIS